MIHHHNFNYNVIVKGADIETNEIKCESFAELGAFQFNSEIDINSNKNNGLEIDLEVREIDQYIGF